MDTSDIPEITLKKVGKDREKKKGGAPLFGGGRGAQAAFRGATGGARGGMGAFGGALGGAGGSGGLAASIAARLGSRIAMRVIMSMVMTALVGGAWGVGKAMKPSGKKAPRAFSDVASMKARDAKKYDNADNLPANHNYQSGLAMVSGSLGGKTPEELAAEKAAAEKAAAEAAAKEQSATADPQAAGAGAVPDPAALAAAAAGGEAAAGGKKEAFGNRFGSLSSSLGGGGSKLSGGAGLSGGMSGKFDTAKLGAGVRGFGNGGTPPRSSGKAPIRSNGGPRGLAARQLNNAFRAGQQSRGQSGTAASYTAGQPFDNGMGTDKLIADPAAAPGAPGGTRGGAGGSSGSGGGGGSSQPNSVGNGLGTDGEPDDCTKILPDTFGDNVKGVQYENSPSGGCVLSSQGSGDSSPWGSMVKIATMLLKVAMILLTVAAIIGLIAKALMGGVITSAAGAALLQVAFFICYAAAALAAIATLLGVAILATGNILGGTIITALGGITAGCAYVAAVEGMSAVSNANTVSSATVAGWQTVGAGLLSGGGAAGVGALDGSGDDPSVLEKKEDGGKMPW